MQRAEKKALRIDRILRRTPPVLEFDKPVLDLVTVAIKALVAFERGFTALGWWNAGRDARGFKRFTEP
jgi:hypothetical protein